MPQLSWIPDQPLDAAIAALRASASAAVTDAERRQRRNVVDPFSSLLIAATLTVDNEAALTGLQSSSSALGGMANALGHFHQEILGHIPGWENHDAGYDLENTQRQLLAEVKNKHNTMNASNREKVVGDLDTAIRQKGRGWTGYLVIIVPKSPARYENKISAREVYEIDGASFYEKAANHSNALHELFDVLCGELGVTDEVAQYCRRVLGASLPPRLG